MTVQEITGLNPNETKKVSEELACLLADMQIFYTNVRGFHWNVKGVSFFQLHAFFESVYNEYAEHIDAIAERMAQLDYAPTHKFSDYLKLARIKEVDSNISASEMLENIAETLKHLIAAERTALQVAEGAKDVATADFLSALIDGQEKAAWMLAASLS